MSTNGGKMGSAIRFSIGLTVLEYLCKFFNRKRVLSAPYLVIDTFNKRYRGYPIEVLDVQRTSPTKIEHLFQCDS